MTISIKAHLESLTTKDENELYLLIGKEQNTNELNFSPRSNKNLISKGVQCFIDAKDRFKDKLCNHPQIKMYILDSGKDRKIEIAAGLVSILLPHYSEITACSISLLIINEGLEKLCNP